MLFNYGNRWIVTLNAFANLFECQVPAHNGHVRQRQPVMVKQASPARCLIGLAGRALGFPSWQKLFPLLGLWMGWHAAKMSRRACP
jgi:hypothetical protein